jgi:hypothetical protein
MDVINPCCNLLVHPNQWYDMNIVQCKRWFLGIESALYRPTGVAEGDDIVTALMAQHVEVDDARLQVPQWATDRYPIDELLSSEPSQTNLAASVTLPALSESSVSRMEVRIVAIGPLLDPPFTRTLQAYDPGLQGVLLAERNSDQVRFAFKSPSNPC